MSSSQRRYERSRRSRARPSAYTAGVLALLVWGAAPHHPVRVELASELTAATPTVPQPPPPRPIPTFSPPTQRPTPTTQPPTRTLPPPAQQPAAPRTPRPAPAPTPTPTFQTPSPNPRSTPAPPAFSAPSPGPNFVQVPRLEGYGLQRAEMTLTQQGLRVGQVSEQQAVAPAGTVVRTSPPAYTAVLPGTRVDLVVARPGS